MNRTHRYAKPSRRTKRWEWILSQPDHYRVLDVERDANERDLKTAWHRFAMKHHPDRNAGGEEASRVRFLRGKQAFDALIDPATRAEHDKELQRREVELLMKLNGSTGIFARKSGPWPPAPGR